MTSILLTLQALIGVLIAYDPGMRLLGGEGRAKALWKYHREILLRQFGWHKLIWVDRDVGLPNPAVIAAHCEPCHD